ncbi:MAG: EFR1 family ferrodoxin [Pseudomonadota bacterium]
MKTVIYYYTGTGNSLWTARLLAAGLGNTEVLPMFPINDHVLAVADAVGLVFPVHMWGVPSPVLNFLKEIKKDPSRYYFACAVNAGQVSRTLIQLQNHMASFDLKLSQGFDIVLPSNYIPWGGPGPVDKLEELYRKAREKIKKAAPAIAERQTAPMERGPLWQRLVFTLIYKLTFKMIPKMDGDFWVDDKCNRCRICEKVCPVGNIVMADDKPTWQHRCEQCLACIQWCPKEAIQYGKKTPKYQRYHHPEVTLKDIIGDSTRERN